MNRSTTINILIGLNIFAALAITSFWTTWFLDASILAALKPDHPEYEIYMAFENAFPLADSWLALAALIGAWGLYRMRDWGFLFTIIAGGSAIFLALMDALYFIQHRMITITSAIIVGLLLILGPAVIVMMWRQRHLLIKKDNSQET